MNNNNEASCRVCGKKFKPCKTCYKKTGVFNYREMCCSPSCGQTYLKQVEQARNPKAKLISDGEAIQQEIKNNKKVKKSNTTKTIDVDKNTELDK